MGIKVPEGMIKAALVALEKHFGVGENVGIYSHKLALPLAIEAALLWQKDNPPKPTPQQGFELRNLALAISRNYGTEEATAASCTAVIVDWVNRMYDEPEPMCVHCGVRSAGGFFDKTLCGPCYNTRSIWGVSEEIKDLLLPDIESGFFKPEILNERLAEAFRRGQKAGPK